MIEDAILFPGHIPDGLLATAGLQWGSDRGLLRAEFTCVQRV